MSVDASPDWMPIRFLHENGQPLVEWCYMDQRRFTEPFFGNTVDLCMKLPFNVLFRQRTPVESLVELQAIRESLPLSGLIFHMSRCGSTLISQMLAANPRNVVLSEAAPIDEVLYACPADSQITDSQRIAWLHAVINALGQRRHPEQQRLFIQFNAWHIHHLPLLHAAFPHVPWVFIYRNPLEVMVSQIRSQGQFFLPTPDYAKRFGVEPGTAWQLPPEEYTARTLAFLLQAALDHRSVAGGLYINYEQLPQAAITTIAAHFGVQWPEEEAELMRNASQFHAKTPYMEFADDREQKQRDTTEAIKVSTHRWLTPLYEQLESQ